MTGLRRLAWSVAGALLVATGVAWAQGPASPPPSASPTCEQRLDAMRAYAGMLEQEAAARVQREAAGARVRALEGLAAKAPGPPAKPRSAPPSPDEKKAP